MTSTRDYEPSPGDIDRLTRFVEVDPNSGCWLWTGALTGPGKKYGVCRLSSPRRLVFAHRAFYAAFKGLPDPNLQVDHTCRTPVCVNPGHLELVTPQENLHRSPHFGLWKTHCPYGHEYTPDNTYIQHKDGYELRSCIKCKREVDQKARYLATREKQLAASRERYKDPAYTAKKVEYNRQLRARKKAEAAAH